MANNDSDINANGKVTLIRNYDNVPLRDIYGGVYTESKVLDLVIPGSKNSFSIGSTSKLTIEHSDLSLKGGTAVNPLKLDTMGKVYAGKISTSLKLNATGAFSDLAFAYTQTVSGTVNVVNKSAVDIVYGAQTMNITDSHVGAVWGGNVSVSNYQITRDTNTSLCEVTVGYRIAAAGAITVTQGSSGTIQGYSKVTLAKVDNKTFGDIIGGTVTGTLTGELHLKTFSDIMRLMSLTYVGNTNNTDSTKGMLYNNTVTGIAASGSLNVSTINRDEHVTLGDVSGFATVTLSSVEMGDLVGGTWKYTSDRDFSYSTGGKAVIRESELKSISGYADLDIRKSLVFGEADALNYSRKNGLVSRYTTGGKLYADTVEFKKNGILQDVTGFSTVTLIDVDACVVASVLEGFLDTTSSTGKITVSKQSKVEEILNYTTVDASNSEINRIEGGRKVDSTGKITSGGSVKLDNVQKFSDTTQHGHASGIYYFSTVKIDRSSVGAIIGGNYDGVYWTAAGSLNLSESEVSGDIARYNTVTLYHLSGSATTDVIGGGENAKERWATGSVSAEYSTFDDLLYYTTVKLTDSALSGSIRGGRDYALITGKYVSGGSLTMRNTTVGGEVHGYTTVNIVGGAVTGAISGGNFDGTYWTSTGSVSMRETSAKDVVGFTNATFFHVTTGLLRGGNEDVKQRVATGTAKVEYSTLDQIVNYNTVTLTYSTVAAGLIGGKSIKATLEYYATGKLNMHCSVSGKGSGATDSITGFDVVTVFGGSITGNVVGGKNYGTVGNKVLSSGSFSLTDSEVEGSVMWYRTVMIKSSSVDGSISGGDAYSVANKTLSSGSATLLSSTVSGALNRYVTVKLDDSTVDSIQGGNTINGNTTLTGSLTLKDSTVKTTVAGYSSVRLDFSQILGGVSGGNKVGGSTEAAGSLVALNNSVLGGVSNIKTVQITDSTVKGNLWIDQKNATGTSLTLDRVTIDGKVSIHGYNNISFSAMNSEFEELYTSRNNDRMTLKNESMIYFEKEVNFGTGVDTLDIAKGSCFAAKDISDLEKVTGAGILYYQNLKIGSGGEVSFSNNVTRHEVDNWDNAFNNEDDSFADAQDLGDVGSGLEIKDELTLFDTADYFNFDISDGKSDHFVSFDANETFNHLFELYMKNSSGEWMRLNSPINLGDGNYCIKFALSDDDSYKKYTVAIK